MVLVTAWDCEICGRDIRHTSSKGDGNYTWHHWDEIADEWRIMPFTSLAYPPLDGWDVVADRMTDSGVMIVVERSDRGHVSVWIGEKNND